MLINVGYYTYFHGITGQTPGKMAMGLKVIQATGEEMTLGIAFLRYVGSIVSSLCFLLGYIWVAFDRRKQGWHDKIAGTVVILKGNRVSINQENNDYAGARRTICLPNSAQCKALWYEATGI